MARPLDPFRTLEVPRDASLDEVKASYRRLAKLYHPDSAGDRALPRFLAIQAAYEALTEGPAALRLGTGTRTRSAGRRPASAPPAAARPAAARPARSPEADAERARATREAASRAGRARPGAGAAGGSTAGGPPSAGTRDPAGARGPAGPTGSGGPRTGTGRSGGSTAGRGRRDRRPPNSTSYDGADLEPFEPEWQGASWYGESSGTYWTINPKEYADPRKHGPEYQARGRRSARGERTGPRGTNPAANPGAARSRASAAADVPVDGPTGADDEATGRAPVREAPPGATTGSRSPYATRPPRTYAAATDDPAGDPGMPRWAGPAVESSSVPPTPIPGSARPPFAVVGVFGIMLLAIGTILVLSPAGPASAGFVPAIFLLAILASAGLVLSGIGGSRRA